jgi:hypothetical protein
MDSKPALIVQRRVAGKAVLGGLFACALVLASGLAGAQGAKPAPASESPGFFSRMGQWFDQTTDNFNAGVRGMRDRFMTFGHEAGAAAKTTVDTTKAAADAMAKATVDNTKAAADAVARFPNTRVVYGHAKCKNAPNGAPDCVAAANEVCKSKGFAGGNSVDMTTAEVCPAQVYLAGRSSGPECHTETFVSRALCQ